MNSTLLFITIQDQKREMLDTLLNHIKSTKALIERYETQKNDYLKLGLNEIANRIELENLTSLRESLKNSKQVLVMDIDDAVRNILEKV